MWKRVSFLCRLHKVQDTEKSMKKELPADDNFTPLTLHMRSWDTTRVIWMGNFQVRYWLGTRSKLLGSSEGKSKNVDLLAAEISVPRRSSPYFLRMRCFEQFRDWADKFLQMSDSEIWRKMFSTCRAQLYLRSLFRSCSSLRKHILERRLASIDSILLNHDKEILKIRKATGKAPVSSQIA